MMLLGRCMRGLFSALSPDRLVDISEVHGGTLGRRKKTVSKTIGFKMQDLELAIFSCSRCAKVR